MVKSARRRRIDAGRRQVRQQQARRVPRRRPLRQRIRDGLTGVPVNRDRRDVALQTVRIGVAALAGAACCAALPFSPGLGASTELQIIAVVPCIAFLLAFFRRDGDPGHRSLPVVLGLAIAAGLFLLCAVAPITAHAFDLHRHGRADVATVVQVRMTVVYGSRSTWRTYSYRLADDQGRVDPHELVGDSDRLHEGDRVDVVFDPARRSRPMYADDVALLWLWASLGGVGLLLALGLAWPYARCFPVRPDPSPKNERGAAPSSDLGPASSPAG